MYSQADDRVLLDNCAFLPVPDPTKDGVLEGVLILQPSTEERGLGKILKATDVNNKLEIDTAAWSKMAKAMFFFQLNITGESQNINSSRRSCRYVAIEENATIE